MYIFTLMIKTCYLTKITETISFQIKMLVEKVHIAIDVLKSGMLEDKRLTLQIARLDEIHPVVSGNKLFKLHYFLAEALKTKQTVVTFGGAYSNHLAATAFACQQAGLESFGIVRGEASPALSPTLQECRRNGMQLIFVSREQYSAISHKTDLINFPGLPANPLVIPEGGYHPMGARGAALIMDKLSKTKADFIVAAVGTATTIAGLLQETSPVQQIIAVPVLKNLADIHQRVAYLNNDRHYTNLEVWGDYHFGGYAKKSPQLISFMNDIYKDYVLPTDFVYTAKMLFAVMDKIKNNFFPAGSSILCLHTGGLQGNRSLPQGTLVF